MFIEFCIKDVLICAQRSGWKIEFCHRIAVHDPQGSAIIWRHDERWETEDGAAYLASHADVIRYILNCA